MGLSLFFTDDEHTAKDDAYVRAMKCRKWVILSAAGFLAIYAGWFTPKLFHIGVGEVLMGIATWRKLAFAALVYAALQYFFLIAQLCSRYPDLLAERFGKRQIEKALSAQDRQQAIAMELSALRGNGVSSVPSSDPQMGGSYHRASLTREALEARIAALTRQQEKLDALIDAMPDRPEPKTWYIICEVCIDILRLGLPVVSAWVAFRAFTP